MRGVGLTCLVALLIGATAAASTAATTPAYDTFEGAVEVRAPGVYALEMIDVTSGPEDVIPGSMADPSFTFKTADRAFVASPSLTRAAVVNAGKIYLTAPRSSTRTLLTTGYQVDWQPVTPGSQFAALP